MSFDVKTISVFERQAKKLAKRHRSLKSDLQRFILQIAENPEQGTSLGHNCYKIRLAISSKGKGKSGGARIITHIAIQDSTVYLLSIYDKTDKESLSTKELSELLQYIIE